MNSQKPRSGSPRKDVLQGPRPSPLKICRDSHRIRKPDPAVPPLPMPIINRSKPMIIHMRSPKIIHAEVQDFMSLVQRLTGSSSSYSSDTRISDHSQNLAADHENGRRASKPEATQRALPAVTSSSPVATTSELSPFSPDFLFPSPRLNFSPSVFKDLPLMTPNSDHLFYSPRDFYRFFEPLFSPPQRPPLNTFTMIRSP